MKRTRTDHLGAIVSGLLIALSLFAGCSRTYYRHQADRQVLGLIAEKANHPHWSIQDYHIQPRPDSRMFDPTNPDCSPMPFDDPTAHRLMHCVDGKHGWRKWHRNGDTPFTQNPQWPAYLPMNERNELVLTANEAVRQGFLNSPTYQRELEEVYLSALDVSFERFRFNTQFFAGYSVDYTADGARRNGSGNSSSLLNLSTFPATNGVRANRLYATGAESVIGFANTLMWQFSGPDDYRGNTLIDFTLTQPLLRNAGRARVMERLTRTERTLLYNVRSMERFRQAYNVQILTGRDPGNGPTRNGGVFGGSGLDGFSGVGGGGFGRVATTTPTSGATGSGGAGAVAGGYLGLLQVRQQIRNQEDNIVRLRENVSQLETKLLELLTTRASSDIILRQRLQVAQARQALLNGQSRLLNSRNDFETSVDGFKAVLGLPPQICVLIQDDLIDDFQLIEPSTNAEQSRIQAAMESIGMINRRILDRVQEEARPNAAPLRRIGWSEELKQDLEALLMEFAPIERMCEELRTENMPLTEEDLAHMNRALPHRCDTLQNLRTRFENEKADLCRLLAIENLDNRIFDPKRLEKLPERLTKEYHRLEKELEEHPDQVQKLHASIAKALDQADKLDDEARFHLLRDEILLAGQTLLSDLRFDILALQLLQARARTESVQLAKIDIQAEQAIEKARRCRHDWMNARAALVDQWRLIEFNANQLESTLDIVFSGDVVNKGESPFNLNSNAGRLKVGVRYDSPITRLSERNVYRQTLIEYQQARRSYYTFEDSIVRNLRQQLRQVAANQLNFELQRFAVTQAAEQILLNDDIRARQEATGQAAGDTAARDSVSALSDLLDAQNNFLSVFVNFEVLRRQLVLDLGTMQLDNEGLWLDPGAITADADENDSDLEAPAPCLREEQVHSLKRELERLPPTIPNRRGKA